MLISERHQLRRQICKPGSCGWCGQLRALILFSLFGLLSGCASRSGTVISDHCFVDKPITIGNADVLTEETAVQIEAHNWMYERMCLDGK